ncbi:carbohydrate-binding module family 14 protein [Streptomyces sp. NPDC099050]|uniref:carbohydrate-binding module family 14 protein n=1 Tax=Streptomyces sp. NPDC099050 TaxID=3366100 RepID=UPI0038259F84
MKKITLMLSILALALAGPGVASAAADDSVPVVGPCPQEGRQFYPDPDYTKFWECFDGTAYRFDRPPGLHGNPRLDACDYPEHACVDPLECEERPAAVEPRRSV